MRIARNTLGVGCAVLTCALSAAFFTSNGPALAQEGGDTAETYAYEGSKSCRKCHSATYKSWEALKHGQALETLKPGNAVEAKTKHNLDPQKDYSTDAQCLKCHVTGWGKEGGYEIPDPEDKKSVRQADKLAGVGCESCHGPSSAYNEVFDDILKSKRKYKVEELYAKGLKPVTEQTCTGCHNAESPTYDASVKFDFEERKKTGVHEHIELKQREG